MNVERVRWGLTVVMIPVSVVGLLPGYQGYWPVSVELLLLVAIVVLGRRSR